jgi:hypothetical protein
MDFNRNIKINFNGGYLTSGSGILLYKEVGKLLILIFGKFMHE